MMAALAFAAWLLLSAGAGMLAGFLLGRRQRREEELPGGAPYRTAAPMPRFAELPGKRPERWIQSIRRRGKAHRLRGSGSSAHARTWCGLWLWWGDLEEAGTPALVFRCKTCVSRARWGW